MKLEHSRSEKNFYLVCLLLLTLVCPASAQTAQPIAQLKAVYVKGKWGYADQAGRMVIKPQFDAARPFKDGLAQVGLLDEELPEIRSAPNLKWGFIDPSGAVIVELRYVKLREFSEGLAAAAIFDDKNPPSRHDSHANIKWGYVGRNGQVSIPMQFNDAGDFAEGLAHVDTGSGRDGMCARARNYGYIDRAGDFVIQPQFAVASSFQNGRAKVSIGVLRYFGRCLCCGPRFFGKHGDVDRSGKFTLDPARGDTSSSSEDGWEGR